MITIQPVSKSDAAAIVSLLNPIIAAGAYTIMTEPVTLAGQLAFIRDLPERAIYLTAVDAQSGRLLGIQDIVPCSSEPAQRHIGVISTFVALDARRSGVGRQLFRVMEVEARAKGFTKLMASIRADNPDALNFYRNMGFDTIGIARNHALVRGVYIDEVLTEYSIAP